jgi:hypothetical protein
MAESDPQSYLDPLTISRGENLGILARQVVEGYRVGEHRSPFKGFAIEFGTSIGKSSDAPTAIISSSTSRTRIWSCSFWSMAASR